MKIRKIIRLGVVLCLLIGTLAGCGNEATAEGSENQKTGMDAAAASVEYSQEDQDSSWKEEEATKITLDGNQIVVAGTGASAEDGILTIQEAGTYVLSGQLEDGQVRIEAGEEDLVRLVLNGATLHSTESAPIYSAEAEKLVLILAEGTENNVQDGAERAVSGEDEEEDEPNAAIYSKTDLTINGGGTLIVEGNYNNGIVSKDDLVVTGGDIRVTAINDGLKGKDSVSVLDGIFHITAGGDGVQSSNEEEGKGWISIDGGEWSISAGDDGVHASSSLVVTDGILTVTESYEGLEGASITLKGGSVHITAEDDGLNAAGGTDGSGTFRRPGEDAIGTATPSAEEGFAANEEYFIQIEGGALWINANGDGIDSNGNLFISGGNVTVNGPTSSNNGAMDYNGAGEITGGTLVLAGSAGMVQTPGDSSTQNVMSIYYSVLQKAGSQVAIQDSDGNVVLEFTPEKEYQSVVFSSTQLVTGEEYTLLADGLEMTRVTVSETVTRISDDGSPVTENPGGRPAGGMMPRDGMKRPNQEALQTE